MTEVQKARENSNEWRIEVEHKKTPSLPIKPKGLNLTETTANQHIIHCNRHLICLLHYVWLFFQETATMQTA